MWVRAWAVRYPALKEQVKVIPRQLLGLWGLLLGLWGLLLGLWGLLLGL